MESAAAKCKKRGTQRVALSLLGVNWVKPRFWTAQKCGRGMCNPSSSICTCCRSFGFVSSRGNPTHPTSAPRLVHPQKPSTMRQSAMPYVRPPLVPSTPGPSTFLCAPRCCCRQSVEVGQLVTATRALQPYKIPFLGLMDPLRNGVERPIRTTAIPPCHWPRCTTCAASPSNPKIAHVEILRHDDPRSPQLLVAALADQAAISLPIGCPRRRHLVKSQV